MSSGLQNLYRGTNQLLQIGSSQPPNLTNIPDRTLQAASPTNFNLLQTTKITTTVSDNSAEKCRSYQGIEGLRRLQKDQANRSYYDSGCGWRYQPSSGINPTINQAAIGTASGPLFGGQGQLDSVSGGTRWYWDLQQAERDITTNICKNVTKCKQLSLLGAYADVCGYCKTTGAVIPIQKATNGQIQARFPGDSVLTCEAADIVTAGSGQCPVEKFQDYGGSSVKSGFGVQGNLREAFTNGGHTLEALESCTPPLTRDCVVLAARMSGCSDSGSLIQSLEGAPPGQDYDSILQTKRPFIAYKQTANPSITNAVLKDGSAALSTALDDFARLVKDTQSPSEKLRLAATDLCLKRGVFTGDQEEGYEGYNFCSEVTINTLIDDNNISCVQKDWLSKGGTEQGTGYPQLSQWKGKSYQKYLDYVNDIFKRRESSDKAINAAALQEFVGVDSFGTVAGKNIPRDDTTRGAETVWIDMGDAATGSAIPVILRCDMRLAKNGEVYPRFWSRDELSAKYRVNPDNVAFTTAFEIRPDSTTNVGFLNVSDDGFMLGYNQNPFEGTAYRQYDWGSWRYQGATRIQSGNYVVNAAKDDVSNVFVMKWFQGIGGAYFHTNIQYDGSLQDQAVSFPERVNLYLTQEPLAPWLQYELCTRPNGNSGNTTGLFEKRWNGQSAYAYGNNKRIPSFDVTSGSVVFQTDLQSRTTVPGRKGYASFVKGSWWHTSSYFAFNAFKTITLLVRPMATPAVGEYVSVYHHCNFKGFSTGLYFKNSGGGRYTFCFWNGSGFVELPAYPNEWNFIVFQYASDAGGLRAITFESERLVSLQNASGLRTFLDRLRAKQNSSGAYLVGSPVANRENSGYLLLGGTMSDYVDRNNRVSWGNQSFTGDVAWIHGFRTFLDTEELLKAEVNQTWISRWPRGNIDGEKEICGTGGALKFLTNEWGYTTVPPGTKVQYGANGKFVSKTLSGGFQATNTFFGGDPIPGVFKAAYCE